MGTIFLVFAVVSGGLYAYTLWFKAKTEAEYPPLGEFVEVEGARLHYLEKGEGPAVVLVHGASGNMRDFVNSIFDRLAENHRVIAFDRPGHGWSERADIEDIHSPAVQARLIHGALDVLGVEDPVLLGHSWAGAVAMAYALAYPDDLKGVIPLAGATHPWEGGVAWYHDVVQTPVIGSYFLRTLMVPAGQALKGPGVEGNFAPDEAPEDFAEDIGLDLLFRPGNFRSNSSDTSHLNAFLAEQATRYGEVRVPTIIIHGSRDRTVGFHIHSQPLHEKIEGSELIRLRGTGHMPHYARPDYVVDAVARLARGESPRAGITVAEPGEMLAAR